MKKKSVILFGKGSLGIKIAEWFQESKEYDLKLIVPVVPEPKWTNSIINFAKKNKIPCVLSGDYQDIEKKYGSISKTDLGFSVFYDKIFNKEFLLNFQRVLNLHNSALPKYRGVRPVHWVLKNKENMHGVTIHEILPGIDNGPIISQVQFSVYPSKDEIIDVYNRALEFAWTLFKETMPILDTIKGIPQDESAATYYGGPDIRKLGRWKEVHRKTKAR